MPARPRITAAERLPCRYYAAAGDTNGFVTLVAMFRTDTSWGWYDATFYNAARCGADRFRATAWPAVPGSRARHVPIPPYRVHGWRSPLPRLSEDVHRPVDESSQGLMCGRSPALVAQLVKRLPAVVLARTVQLHRGEVR